MPTCSLVPYREWVRQRASEGVIWITRKWETTPNAGTSRRVSGVASAARGCQGRKSVACLSVCSWLGPSTVVRSPSVRPQRTAHSQKGGAGGTSDRPASVREGYRLTKVNFVHVYPQYKTFGLKRTVRREEPAGQVIGRLQLGRV